jgi:hypothetical protein
MYGTAAKGIAGVPLLLIVSMLGVLSEREPTGEEGACCNGGRPHTAIRGRRCRTYSGGRSIRFANLAAFADD